MIISNVTIDLTNDTSILEVIASEYTNLIAEFNGVVVEGVKVNDTFTFTFNNIFLDYVIVFKSDNIIVFRYYLSKPVDTEFKNTLYENLELKESTLIATIEGAFYADGIDFKIEDGYNRGLNDGLILGKMI